MEVLHELADNGTLVQKISNANFAPDVVVPVEINLPEYLDATSLLAMYKRMVEVSKVTGHKLRLVGKTKNLEVEKFATRLFADRDDIFLSVEWREMNE